MGYGLDGAQTKQLLEALLDAFPTQAGLAQMVKYGLNKPLAAIAGGANLTDVAFNLIQWAEARGMLDSLVVAARNENPGNLLLRDFAEGRALAPAGPPQGQLERIVLGSQRFTDTEQWRQRMSECELTVCRVEIPRLKGIGTGFLVGPTTLMTNHHVLQDVITYPSLREHVVLRFDFKTTADGITVREGQEFRLADDWLIDFSPPEQLDFALVRVKGQPGTQPVGGQMGAPQRGWLLPVGHTFQVSESIQIIQHPEANPLKIASGSITALKAGQNRILYSANTERGSSGSPCFDGNWDLVALHHYGDKQEGNEGVIFSAIADQPKVKAVLGT
jgi:hypothetical protein